MGKGRIVNLSLLLLGCCGLWALDPKDIKDRQPQLRPPRRRRRQRQQQQQQQQQRQLHYDSAATDDSNPAVHTPIDLPLEWQEQLVKGNDKNGKPLALLREVSSQRQQTNQTAGARISERIMGGSPAGLNQFGWYASPYHEDCEFDWFDSEWNCQQGRYLWSGCGGSLIGPRHVLTAAHCIDYKLVHMPGIRMYEIGAYCQVLDFADNCQQYSELIPIERIDLHPSFAKGLGNVPVFDFAMITLQKASTIPPVPWDRGQLPPLTDGETVSVAGFGATVDYGNMMYGGTPDVLQFANLQFVSDEPCARVYREAQTDFEITPEMMCALDTTQDACAGDSGGPLLSRDSSGHPVLRGVVSWGVGCALGTLPGVYAQLNQVVDWMDSFLVPPIARHGANHTDEKDDTPQISADEAPADKEEDDESSSSPDNNDDASGCQDLAGFLFTDDSDHHRKCKWLQKGGKKKRKRRRTKYCNGDRGKALHVICAKSCGLCPKKDKDKDENESSSPFTSVHDFL